MNASQPPPDVEGASHRTVAIDTEDAGRIDLHVLEAGEGPPVLMLHGWPQHAWCWRHVIPRLAADHRLICPDLRGFGWSDAPPGGYDPVTFAADSASLLDALGLDRAHVIGHDWGGSAAFALALTRPERVDRMLVLNTAPPWIKRTPRLIAGAWRSWYAFVMAGAGGLVLDKAPDQMAKGIRRDLVHPEGITEEDARAYVDRLRLPDRRHATQQLYRTYVLAMAGAGPVGGLADLRLSTPTRFLFGAQDGAIPTHILEGAEEHADDLVVELVEDSGHFIAEEKPELVARRARERFGT